MNCQMFSTGLSSGDLGGKGMRLTYRDGEFIEHPPRQIDQPPAHDTMRRRHGASSTILAKLRRCASFSSGVFPGALRLTNPLGSTALKASTQSRTVCKPTPPTLARLAARAPVVNRRQRQQPPRLSGISRPLRQLAQLPGFVSPPNTDRRSYSKPPLVCHGESYPR